MTFRSVLFWVHLAAGLVCGVVIGILCLTGTALAFEKDLIAWSERDARRVEAPPRATPLALDELADRFRQAKPGVQPSTIVVQADPHAAVAFAAGRSGTYYLNPYTGELREPASKAMAGFMQTMLVWHRYLGFSGEQSRPRGKLVTGVANVAFLVLAVTGLYLWVPRTWSWRALRPVIWFRQNATTRARDFNWHNTIGFWSAPVLIVLTLTAMPISFRWAGSFLYALTGTPLPASGPQSSGTPIPTIDVPAPAAGAQPLALNVLLSAAREAVPGWQTITLRLAAPGAKAGPAYFTVRTRDSWPRTANTTLQLDPFTGKTLRRDGHADLDAARRLRGWTRYLHTGEAVGWLGQLVAGIASLGGAVLVVTGIALSCRRFFGGGRSAETAPANAAPRETANRG
ncbi:MAG: PepSY domain-containing protein [Opitutaceae bacterium]|nr:PepSY domain-containing protein [Opitutaceae bacterium]